MSIKPETAIKGTNCQMKNSVVIEPCFLGNNVSLTNSVVGPYVSIGEGSSINDSRVSDTIILSKAEIHNAIIINSLIGNSARVKGSGSDLSAGDFSDLEI